MSKGFLAQAKEGTVISVRVSTGARRTSIEGPYGENAVKFRVAAPPTAGRANDEAERFLAQALGVARRDVAVIDGTSSRDKKVLVRGLGRTDTQIALSAHLP